MRRISILSIIGILIILVVLILLILRSVGIIESSTDDRLLIALVVGLILHALKVEGDIGRIKAKMGI
ncbi:MAG: hypothetical protein QMD36_04705 [Candidatus Aenigmarchaeota archaeon]|nr:hypothetical protein [Candidatus Aenigmarchaeota archaeon]